MGGGQTSGGTSDSENIQQIDSQRESEPLNNQVTSDSEETTSDQSTDTDVFETPTIDEVDDNSNTSNQTPNSQTGETAEQSTSSENQFEIVNQSNPTTATRSETLELTSSQQDLQRHEEFKQQDTYDAPTPKEFAEEHLSEGNEARHIAIGLDGRTATIGDFNSNSDAGVIGGWGAFGTESIGEETGLNIEKRKSDYMYKVQLNDDTIAADTAYMTDFNVPDAESGLLAPSKGEARSQMGVHAGLDAMGVRTPQQAFDTDTKKLYVEAVGETRNAVKLSNYSTVGQANPDTQPPMEHIDKINESQFKDVMAANLICGNADLGPDNLFVDEDGNVLSFDYDMIDTFDSPEEIKGSPWEEQIQYTLEAINRHRAEKLDTSVDDILDRAEDLATELNETGMVDRVTDAAKEYDDFFTAESNDEYHDSVPRSSTHLVIKRHVSSWSQD